jgi:hypothetical protein
MGIMDKIQEGLSKGKELVNKTMGGQQSAQGTASPQDPAASVTDAGGPATDPSTETPTPAPTTETTVEPTSEA